MAIGMRKPAEMQQTVMSFFIGLLGLELLIVLTLADQERFFNYF